jgi:ABC-type nitrate/sulfonate/bicarbonate transport system substrate-binding protein
MKHFIHPSLSLAALALSALVLTGCKPQDSGAPSSGAASTSGAKAPTFSLAWSEYPSWSTFGVAHVDKLIDGREGQLGPIEKKWNVDIVLKEAEYDPCLTLYGTAGCDAVCITDMDALNPSLTRASVAILPTSTSFGADACLVPNTVTDVKQLKGKKVFGLAKSVSEYCFARNLEILGEKESEYTFSNMDPSAAAVAMQQKQKEVEAIVVWNPFVLETLNKRPDVKVLFDSTKIPNEIIDMVVVAQASLEKPGGADFACAVIDTFYTVCQRMADPATADKTLVALGEKFSHLDLASMKKVVQQTKFYRTPKDGLAVFTGAELPSIMKKVVEFCVKHEITASAPKVGYGTKATAPDVALRFDPTYLQKVQERK